MNRQMRSGGAGFYVLVLAIIGIAMYISSIMTSSTSSQYNVEDFKQDVKAGKVPSVRSRRMRKHRQVLCVQIMRTSEVNILIVLT